jgi:hypothetical protein
MLFMIGSEGPPGQIGEPGSPGQAGRPGKRTHSIGYYYTRFIPNIQKYSTFFSIKQLLFAILDTVKQLMPPNVLEGQQCCGLDILCSILWETKGKL